MKDKRKCRQCGEIKPDVFFYRDPAGASGRKSICIECMKDQREEEAARPLAQPANVLTTIPDRCPRCQGLVFVEPLYVRCRHGCGRLFRRADGDVAAQRQFEHSRGMLLPS